MKKSLPVLVVAVLAVAVSSRSMAADAFGAWTNGLPTGWVEGPTCDPYVDYNCTPSKAMMALKASRDGTVRVLRAIAADDFFQGLYETAREPDLRLTHGEPLQKDRWQALPCHHTMPIPLDETGP